MISIIVPAYNAARFLGATLDTVCRQTYQDWELLVINDGSTDETESVAKDFAQKFEQKDQLGRIKVFTIANGGACRARNYGFSQADPRSRSIMFLDHDDLLEPFTLEVLLATLSSRPDAVAAVGAVQENVVTDIRSTSDAVVSNFVNNSNNNQSNSNSVDDSNSVDKRKADGHGGILTFVDMVSFCQIWTMGQVLIRRDCLERVGPLDPTCGASDDWDLYLRLTRHGPFVTTPTVVIRWTHHAANTSNDKTRMAEAEEAVRAKLLASPDLSDEQRLQIQELFKRTRYQLAYRQWGWAKEAVGERRFGDAVRQAGRACVNYLRARRHTVRP